MSRGNALAARPTQPSLVPNVDFGELAGFQFDSRAAALSAHREKKEFQEFKRLCKRLQCRNWTAKTRRERGASYERLRDRNRSELARQRLRIKMAYQAYLAAPHNAKGSCALCGLGWCPMLLSGPRAGKPSRFCSKACEELAWYRKNRKPGARVNACGKCGAKGHTIKTCPDGRELTSQTLARLLTIASMTLAQLVAETGLKRHSLNVSLCAMAKRGLVAKAREVRKGRPRSVPGNSLWTLTRESVSKGTP